MTDASARFVAALPLGTRIWLPGLGRSMKPLLRSGDVLQVERCDAQSVRRGDVAVIQTSDSRLVAHFVVSAAPLVTSSFSGQEDAEAAAVLGRVVAVRRGTREWPFRSYVTTGLALIQPVTAHPWMRGVSSTARGILGRLARTPMGRNIRRRVLEPSVIRRLTSEQVQEGQFLLAEARFKASAEDAWLGLFDRAGRLRGTACVTRDGRVGVFVSPVARRLGFGRQLVKAVLAEARSDSTYAARQPFVSAGGPSAFWRACRSEGDGESGRMVFR